MSEWAECPTFPKYSDLVYTHGNLAILTADVSHWIRQAGVVVHAAVPLRFQMPLFTLLAMLLPTSFSRGVYGSRMTDLCSMSDAGAGRMTCLCCSSAGYMTVRDVQIFFVLKTRFCAGSRCAGYMHIWGICTKIQYTLSAQWRQTA